MKNSLGFTLIELIAVIGIMLTLIAIGIPSYNSWINRNRIADAESTIAKIEMALEMYKTDIGNYPQCAGNLNLNANGILKQALIDSFVVTGITYGPYMKYTGNYSGNNLLDPWGIIYGAYTAPGSAADPNFRYNKTSYYIYSFGPDKLDGNVSQQVDNVDNFKK
jgi:type II secretory pathway pseudopilin PulG